MKVLDLFSGIGGFSLGFESTGHFQTTKFVEMDKYCQKILRKNFPGIKIEEDIRNVKGQEFEADVITGGFPCQPFSVAGKQKGTDDNRYLWPEMFRLIKEIKPRWVVGENVQGIINLKDGMVLRQVLDDLEGEGFEVQCFIIPASGIGAWHQRKRVWIVGYSKHNGSLAAKIQRSNNQTSNGTQERKNSTIELKRTSGSRNNGNVSDTKIIGTRKSREFNKEKGSKESGSTQSNSSSTNVSNTNDGQRNGENKEIRSRREAVEYGSKGNVPNAKSFGTQRLWSFREQEPATYGEEELSLRQSQNSGKSWWEIESNICGVPDGLSYELDKARAPRIKALGNSIVPQIAREIALAIIEAENNNG